MGGQTTWPGWKNEQQQTMSNGLYIATEFTPRHGFTDGIEGPAGDRNGNIYAVNYAHQGTIGKGTVARMAALPTLPWPTMGTLSAFA